MPSFLFNIRWQLLLLAVICGFSFFAHLDAANVDLMEARNFVTAREMVRNGSWWVPTMNGEIRITKPPLPTWLTALVRLGSGDRDDNRVMRLPAAMAASLLVLCMYGFMRTVTHDELLPFLCAAVLATCFMIIEMGRRGSWDIHCHSYMLGAVWALSAGWQKRADQGAYGVFILAGLGLAASFMSKGPVAFFAFLLPFMGAYIYAFGIQMIRRRWKELLLALAICIALSAIWPAYVYINYPEISAAVAKAETGAWTGRHVRPFYFYAPFAMYTGLWAIVVLTGFYKPFAGTRIDRFLRYRFVLTWTIASLLLLSVIPEKKERYLLPAIIPLAIMAACLLRAIIQAYADRRATKGDARLLAAHTILSTAAAFLIPVGIAVIGLSKEMVTPLAVIFWGVCFILLGGGMIAFVKKGRPGYIFLLTVLLTCMINAAVLPIFYDSPLYQRNPSHRSLAQLRENRAIQGFDLYHVGKINLKRVWELGQVVHPWPMDYQSGLDRQKPIILLWEGGPSGKGALGAETLQHCDLVLLDSYRFHPKNGDRIKHVALLKPQAIDAN